MHICMAIFACEARAAETYQPTPMRSTVVVRKDEEIRKDMNDKTWNKANDGRNPAVLGIQAPISGVAQTGMSGPS